MFFVSLKNRRTSNPPSRPNPDDLTPPKGVRKSLCIQVFTHTIPHSRFSEKNKLRFKLLVQTVADNPYLTSFAISKTCDSDSKGIMVTTGPKISSWFN